MINFHLTKKTPWNKKKNKEKEDRNRRGFRRATSKYDEERMKQSTKTNIKKMHYLLKYLEQRLWGTRRIEQRIKDNCRNLQKKRKKNTHIIMTKPRKMRGERERERANQNLGRAKKDEGLLGGRECQWSRRNARGRRSRSCRTETTKPAEH